MKDRSSRTLFEQVRQDTTTLLDDTRKALLALPNAVRPGLLERLEGVAQGVAEPLTIAIAGEYNTGKTTIINALAGARQPTASRPTTADAHVIEYQDIRLVDMPGTLSGLLEHDELARKAVLDSDLMLFVVTNELFNASSLPYFRKAIDEFKKVDQCMLVVNQIDRINLTGRTVEEAITLLSEVLRDQVAPFSLDEFPPVFVSARDYLDALDEEETEEERAALRESSRIDGLREAIDAFCHERGAYGRLARPLQLLRGLLAAAIEAVPKDSAEMDVVLSHMKQKDRIFATVLKGHRTRVRNLQEDVRAKCARTAEPVLKAIETRASEEGVADAYNKANEELEDVINWARSRVQEKVEEMFTDLASQLKELDESAVTDELESIAVGEMRTASPGEENPLKTPTAPGEISRQTKIIIKNLLSSGGKKLTENAESIAQAAVKIVGKLHKFKPWGKIKLAGKISETLVKSSKWLGPIGVGIEMYIEYRNERQKDEAERLRREFKGNVRRQFREFGIALSEDVNEAAEDAARIIAELRDELHAQRRALIEADKNSSAQALALEKLDHRAVVLLESIRA